MRARSVAAHVVLSAALSVALFGVDSVGGGGGAFDTSDPTNAPRDDYAFMIQSTDLESSPPKTERRRGVFLSDVTWVEAETLLTPTTVVVIALGAAAKEHGPHLLLGNDFLLAEYLARRIAERADVVIAPTMNYGFYPAFVEYPGSTSLRLPTARDMIVDVCRGLARFGPRRFYIINTGVSPLKALEPAAAALAREGLLLRYTDILRITEPIERSVSEQEKGSHADEIETSMMLYIAPETVDMRKAARDYGVEHGPGPLTRDPKGKGTYSPTGIYGDATLASREKGKKVTEALIEGILAEIESTRTTPLPGDEPSGLRPETK
jgi:creatinine amidohydrolase